MRKTLIVAAAAAAGAVALPGTASAGTIYCDAWDRVQERVGKDIAYCIDDPNPVDQAIRDVLGLIELTP